MELSGGHQWDDSWAEERVFPVWGAAGLIGRVGLTWGRGWGKTEIVGDFETLHSEFVEVGQ